MGKHKIYISLPITGYDVEERKERAENMKTTIEAGIRSGRMSAITAKNGQKIQLYPNNTEVVTPFDIVPDPTGLSYADIMGLDLTVLLKSHVVFFAKDWQTSKGCRIEYAVAKELGPQMYFV